MQSAARRLQEVASHLRRLELTTACTGDHRSEAQRFLEVVNEHLAKAEAAAAACRALGLAPLGEKV